MDREGDGEVDVLRTEAAVHVPENCEDEGHLLKNQNVAGPEGIVSHQDSLSPESHIAEHYFVTIQAMVRAWLARKKFQKDRSDIVTTQAIVRAWLARKRWVGRTKMVDDQNAPSQERWGITENGQQEISDAEPLSSDSAEAPSSDSDEAIAASKINPETGPWKPSYGLEWHDPNLFKYEEDGTCGLCSRVIQGVNPQHPDPGAQRTDTALQRFHCDHLVCYHCYTSPGGFEVCLCEKSLAAARKLRGSYSKMQVFEANSSKREVRHDCSAFESSSSEDLGEVKANAQTEFLLRQSAVDSEQEVVECCRGDTAK